MKRNSTPSQQIAETRSKLDKAITEQAKIGMVLVQSRGFSIEEASNQGLYVKCLGPSNFVVAGPYRAVQQLGGKNTPSELTDWVVSISVPMAGEGGDILEQIAKDTKKFDVFMRITTLEGPSGGWPECEVAGAKENVKKFLVSYYYDDAEEAEELHPEVFS